MPNLEPYKYLTFDQKLGILQQLIQMARADKIFKFIEFKYLTEVAELMGIKAAQLDTILESNIELPLPEKKIERARQLHRLVVMMMIDHEIRMEELILLKKMAERFDLKSDGVSAMIKAMHANKGGMILDEELKVLFFIQEND